MQAVTILQEKSQDSAVNVDIPWFEDLKRRLLETLRVLKKGGTFAIHDIFSKMMYGDLDSFVRKLKEIGYQDVRLISTTDGMFMTKEEARRLMLTGSALLMGLT